MIIKKNNLKIVFVLLNVFLVSVGLGLYCFSQATAEETMADNQPANGTKDVLITTSDGSLFSWTDSVTGDSGTATDSLIVSFKGDSWIQSYCDEEGAKTCVLYDGSSFYEAIEHAITFTMDNDNWIYKFLDQSLFVGQYNYVIESGIKTFVNFDPNGGEWTPGDFEIKNVGQFYGCSLILEDDAPAWPITEDGKNFIGWFTQDGQYVNTDLVIVDSTIAESTLYAGYESSTKADSFNIICPNADCKWVLYDDSLEPIKNGTLNANEKFSLDNEYLPDIGDVYQNAFISTLNLEQTENLEGSSQLHIRFKTPTGSHYTLIFEADLDKNQFITGGKLNGEELIFNNPDNTKVLFKKENSIILDAVTYKAKDITLCSKRNLDFKYMKVEVDSADPPEPVIANSLELKCGEKDMISLCNSTFQLLGVNGNDNFYGTKFVDYKHYENNHYTEYYIFLEGLNNLESESGLVTKIKGFEYQGCEFVDNRMYSIFVTDFETPLNLLVESKPETYNVTFDACGGTFSDGKSQLSLEQNTNSHYVFPDEDPVLDGREFLGWYTEKEGGELISANMYPWYTYQPEYFDVAYAHWSTPVVPPDPGTDPGTEVINGTAQTGDSALYVGICFMILLASASVFVYRKNRITK